MEKHLEAKLRKSVKSKGGLCLKWVSPGTKGIPDRIVLMPGKVYFVEMKYAKGTLSPQQRLVHAMFKQLGLTVHTLSNAEEVNIFVDNI